MKVGPSPARARATRFPRRLVDREHVCPVHAQARHAVADRLVGEGLGARLRLERRRDRPAGCCCRSRISGAPVTAAKFAPSWNAPSEVAPSPKNAIAHARSPLELLAPRETRGVWHVRRDRHADRGDVVVLGVPPAGRMPAPPRQDRRRRQSAQQADRGLSVRGEDPVLVVERMDDADLHRLVVPEDRVRADAPLPVVDDRALVVRAQQDHRAVELEQLLLAEAVDLAVARAVGLADDTPQIALGRKNRHCGRSLPGE